MKIKYYLVFILCFAFSNHAMCEDKSSICSSIVNFTLVQSCDANETFNDPGYVNIRSQITASHELSTQQVSGFQSYGLMCGPCGGCNFGSGMLCQDNFGGTVCRPC